MEWSKLLEKPLFSLTSDQDWAPAWAARDLLERVRRAHIPLHVFRTNPCQVLERAVNAGEITQGWHPNFLPDSSHGRDSKEVIRYMKDCFPGAKSVRSHCFAEDAHRWEHLAQAGIVADSQMPTRFQGYLMPLMHASGIVRFPIFFEDDLFFDLCSPELSLAAVKRNLFTPGLKVLNFHPTFVACNTPHREHYEQVRNRVFGSDQPPASVIWRDRGTANVLSELIALIRSEGFEFHSFLDLVDQICDSSTDKDFRRVSFLSTPETHS